MLSMESLVIRVKLKSSSVILLHLWTKAFTCLSVTHFWEQRFNFKMFGVKLSTKAQICGSSKILLSKIEADKPSAILSSVNWGHFENNFWINSVRWYKFILHPSRLKACKVSPFSHICSISYELSIKLSTANFCKKRQFSSTPSDMFRFQWPSNLDVSNYFNFHDTSDFLPPCKYTTKAQI